MDIWRWTSSGDNSFKCKQIFQWAGFGWSPSGVGDGILYVCRRWRRNAVVSLTTKLQERAKGCGAVGLVLNAIVDAGIWFTIRKREHTSTGNCSGGRLRGDSYDLGPDIRCSFCPRSLRPTQIPQREPIFGSCLTVIGNRERTERFHSVHHCG